MSTASTEHCSTTRTGAALIDSTTCACEPGLLSWGAHVSGDKAIITANWDRTYVDSNLDPALDREIDGGTTLERPCMLGAVNLEGLLTRRSWLRSMATQKPHMHDHLVLDHIFDVDRAMTSEIDHNHCMSHVLCLIHETENRFCSCR